MKLPDPFAYPREPHRRKHGPMGYRRYSMYRQWLRDEWSFRCAYCLTRERWRTRRRDWSRDHFEARKHRPDLALEYDNLVHACGACNGVKSTQHLPDPCTAGYGELVKVDEYGRIHPRKGREREGRELIHKMQLDDPEMDALRKDVRTRIKAALELGLNRSTARELLKCCLGYPDDLPDLSQEQPPGGNRRPEGLQQSYFELSKKPGGLPDYY
jgi:hypothetical protein